MEKNKIKDILALLSSKIDCILSKIDLMHI